MRVAAVLCSLVLGVVTNAQAPVNAVDVDYQPTVLRDVADADSLYQDLQSDFVEENGHYPDPYVKAHLWANDLHTKRGIKGMKVFIFFTEAFKNASNEGRALGTLTGWKWWFHGATFVYAGADQQEIVLDRDYTKKPMPLGEYIAKFTARTGSKCVTLDRSKDYQKELKNSAEHCFVLKVPMYYLHPWDVQAAHLQNKALLGFRMEDLVRVNRVRGRSKSIGASTSRPMRN